MSNAGFSAATDIFSLGSSWGVKSANLNRSCNTAECPNGDGDITHRDTSGERIAPSAEYVLLADVTSLPALGTIVTIDSKKVAISSISVKTTKGSAPTATVSGVQVEDSASEGRTYSCGTIALSARHKAQDILVLLGSSRPATLTDGTFTFTADVTVADPKGVIGSSDASNGKVVAAYTHTVGDSTAITAPTLSGTDVVVGSPVTKNSPEGDYTTYEFAVTKSLIGTDPTISN